MGMWVGREFETRHPFIICNVLFCNVSCFHFCVFIFVFSFLFIYTPMEVVCPVGMFVYTAVYKLAADGAVLDTPEKKSMVRGTPKRKPRYLISTFMFSFLCATRIRYARTIKGNIPITKKN